MAADDADTTRTDQLTFQNPVTRYPQISPPEQQQAEPGLQAEITPQPDIGEFTYRGTGRLEGRRALITGGDSGIGAAVAVAFAREGADVAVNYLPAEEEDAREVARIITETGRRAVRLPGDLTDPQVCRDIVERAVAELGGLDILVNNAAKQIANERLEETPDQQIVETFEANMLAMFRVTKAALQHLPAGATIINSTSLVPNHPPPPLLDYPSPKRPYNNYSMGRTQELAPRPTRVTPVSP